MKRPVCINNHIVKYGILNSYFKSIASSMNTSERMIRETYLDNTDEVLMERAKLMNKSYMKNKIKVVK